MNEREGDLLHHRKEKLQRLRQRNIEPYPTQSDRSCTNLDAIQQFEQLEKTGANASELNNISLTGRIISIRAMGKATFLDLKDGSGQIQVHLRHDKLGEKYDIIKDLDVGDFLGVNGSIFRTRRGEITIEALNFTILAKTMRPLPEKWHGLKDIEQRYRQRYIDLIVNDNVKNIFIQRSHIITALRAFLDKRGFIEVETPILVPVASGTFAHPFITHYRALGKDLFLRIATELYLKRLIVGGLDKVYEIGRVFRNEGVDQNHNPEFTLLESYEAYVDYNHVMTMVEEMIANIAEKVIGTTSVKFNGEIIELDPPWKRISLKESLKKHSGINIDIHPDAEGLAQRMKEIGVDVGENYSRGRLMDKLVSMFVEPTLIQPTFLLDYPEDMSPLAKPKPGMPGYVERFEGFVAGMELANSFTELNNPEIQRQRFLEQETIRKIYKDEEVERMDEDFLLSLEYGMPPTGGLGIGIDRLVMLLTSQTSIRDVVFFPQMRSKDT